MRSPENLSQPEELPVEAAVAIGSIEQLLTINRLLPVETDSELRQEIYSGIRASAGDINANTAEPPPAPVPHIFVGDSARAVLQALKQADERYLAADKTYVEPSDKKFSSDDKEAHLMLSSMRVYPGLMMPEPPEAFSIRGMSARESNGASNKKSRKAEISPLALKRKTSEHGRGQVFVQLDTFPKIVATDRLLSEAYESGELPIDNSEFEKIEDHLDDLRELATYDPNGVVASSAARFEDEDDVKAIRAALDWGAGKAQVEPNNIYYAIAEDMLGRNKSNVVMIEKVGPEDAGPLAIAA